jgi:hypothetical protein
MKLNKKYWWPIKNITEYICNHIPEGCKVLELGPGAVPLPKATHFCGWSDKEKEKFDNYKVVDFSTDKLPYKDKEFDFVYARHVLEDLYNPFNCMDEMSRVAKAGFIECPSPIAEVCRDVENWKDFVQDDIKLRGYSHHHYIVWNDGKLNFLHKFPVIERMQLIDEDYTYELLKNPYNWNTYYIWKDKIEYKNYNHPQDYSHPGGIQYPELIIKGFNTSIEVNKSFEKEFKL